MALTANALLTLAEAREELREKSQAFDSVIERRINALSETFEGRSGWILTEQDLEGYRVSGAGGRILLLPIVPIQDVDKIEIRSAFDDTVVTTITDTSKFILKGKDKYEHSITGRLQLFEDIFIRGTDNIAIDMTVGFAADHPRIHEAKRLLIMQLQFEYRRWQQNEAGVISRSLADGSVSFAPPQNLLKEVEDGLIDIRSWRFC